MSEPTPVETNRPGLVILNPVAGDGKPDQVRAALAAALPEDAYRIYETTGDDSLRDVVREAIADGIAWVAAAGGDGTVSEVGDGLAGSDIPLAIIPAGTGNVLAQELGIPLEAEAACALLSGSPTRCRIDGLKIGERYFFLHAGVGLESKTMSDTSRAEKNRWGILAYLWTLVKNLFGWQPHQFTLTLDGEVKELRAMEVLIANAAAIGVLDLEWHEKIRPDDGRMDIIVVPSRSPVDILHVLQTVTGRHPGRSDHVQFFTARESIHIAAETTLPVQGDGDIIGDMPLAATVVPGALTVLVPTRKND